MGRKIDVTLSYLDNFSKGFKKTIKTMSDGSRRAQRMSRSIEKAGSAISNVGAKMTAAITVPIIGLGTASVKSFGEVDKSLRLVESTMGNTKWAAADLTGAVADAAADSVFSMQEAADASLNFARQGFNAKEAADMLAPALYLASGTATDLSEVTSGLGNTLKVFADQGLTASQAADVFAKAQAQANTSASELFSAMSVGSSIFNTVGWSMQDLAAVTDVFGDNFISGSEGANAMKTGLAKLVSPAKDGAAWIERLRLNITNSDGTMKSMVSVQEQLHDAFSGLTQEQQMQAASAIFGKNQMGKWLTLINTAPSKVQGYRLALNDATGTANEMSDSLMDGVGGSIEKLKSTFDVFKYSVGNAIADPVKKAVDWVTKLVDKFRNLSLGSQQQVVKFAAIAAAAGPVLIVFGKMVAMIGQGFRTFNRIKGAISATSGVMGVLTGPVGIAIAAVTALVVAGVLLYKNWDKIKSTATKVFNYVKKVFKSVGLSGKDMKKQLSSVGKSFQSLGKKGQELWKLISTPIKKLGNLVTSVFKVRFKIAINNGIKVFSILFSSTVGVVNGLLTAFGGLIDFVTGVFTGNWRKAWNGVKQIFSGVFSSLVSVAKAPMNAVISLINGAISRINGIGVTIPSWVPGVGGKSFSVHIPSVPKLAKGTKGWKGGLAEVSEGGRGEIIDLPKGSRVYPYNETKKILESMADGNKITIAKLADQIIVREEADIDKIAERLANKLASVSLNMGGAI